jgi:hypothetical protein
MLKAVERSLGLYEVIIVEPASPSMTEEFWGIFELV